MFKIIIFSISILSGISFGSTNFLIQDICHSTDLINLKMENLNTTLGELTINILNEKKIPYSGSNSGLSSINNSAKGDEAIQILSDDEMLAFGWCYKIDNVLSEEMPDAIKLESNVKEIRWYFGYAHYLKGRWISQCEENKSIIQKYYCQ